jgi:hypothetical protein
MSEVLRRVKRVRPREGGIGLSDNPRRIAALPVPCVTGDSRGVAEIAYRNRDNTSLVFGGQK